jgi:DNA-binding NtrC family response regulator
VTDSGAKKRLPTLGTNELTDGGESARREYIGRVSVVLHHHDGARVAVLSEGESIVIGREEPVDVSIADDSISRRHVRFALEGGAVYVEDLGSTNGTHVNGALVTRTLVRPGDEIGIGAVTAGIHVLAPPLAEKMTLAGHDEFCEVLERELARAKKFERTFGLLVVRSLAGAWDEELHQRVRGALEIFHAIGEYSAAILEVGIAETTREELIARAKSIICETAVAGGALFPESATSIDGLFEAALTACREANERDPIRIARPAGPWRISLAEQRPDRERAPIAHSPAMQQVLKTASRAAAATLPVLLSGETGTGKEVVARWIHAASDRRAGPLLCVNCAAIPATLVESTLFGHEKSAFTDAKEQAKGVFESAEGGAVFLDEIGELSLSAQAALLRAIEEKKIVRVGGVREVDVDVRIISATNRDLEEMTRAKMFREDLYYRLNGIAIEVPPLRERPADILPLASYFLRRANELNKRDLQDFEADVLQLLFEYPWPGNVRELRNAIERAVAISDGPRISAADFPEKILTRTKAANSPSETIGETVGDLRERVQTFETQLIVEALEKTGGNQTLAARSLGVPLRTLLNKMKSHGIKRLTTVKAAKER